jgi:hypothetical protein
VNELPELAEQHARRLGLADVDRELARRRSQHDIAMSAFQFDEAAALLRTIAALEQQRQALADDLPAAAAPVVEPPTGVVPVLNRRRQGALRRRYRPR